MAVAKPATAPRWASLLAWQASHYYTVGERVTNDAGKLYQADTAGTSAGSGGPTGTAANIVDGTTRWDYVGATAPAWVAATVYAVGDLVTNSGDIFRCVGAGTSGGAGPAYDPWAPSTTYATSDVIFNRGNYYICSGGGVSGPTGGPTGSSSAIADGTVSWNFYGTVFLDGTAQWTYLSAATAITVDPPAGWKDTGWATGERPPAQVFNWFMQSVYLWILYLQDLAAQAFTWTAAHIFQAAVTMQKGLTVTQSTTNGTGVDSTGNGTAYGGNFVGGATGNGLRGAGGGSNKNGVVGESGGGTGAGVYGTSISGAGPGVQGVSASSGPGVKGSSDGTGMGGDFTGGSSDGTGVLATGGATNGIGLRAVGTGTGLGVSSNKGITADTGNLIATAGDVVSRHVLGNSSTPTKAAGVGQASTPVDADVVVTGTDSGGQIQVTGRAGSVAGTVCTITFTSDFPNYGNVVICAANSTAGLLFPLPYVGTPVGGADNGFTIQTLTGGELANGSVYQWNYVNIGK